MQRMEMLAAMVELPPLACFERMEEAAGLEVPTLQWPAALAHLVQILVQRHKLRPARVLERQSCRHLPRNPVAQAVAQVEAFQTATISLMAQMVGVQTYSTLSAGLVVLRLEEMQPTVKIIQIMRPAFLQLDLEAAVAAAGAVAIVAGMVPLVESPHLEAAVAVEHQERNLGPVALAQLD
jgi:hypothetical protein